MDVKQKNRIVIILLPIILIILIVLVRNFNSNSPSKDSQIICEGSYIKYGTDCCLDSDNNKICDYLDTNAKTNTINPILNFEVPFIQNLDCSDPKNFNKTQIRFEIARSCRSGSFVFSSNSLEECNTNGGEYIPAIGFESYPSLNEYKLSGLRLKSKNNGCTKIYSNDLSIDIYLYHNEELNFEQLNNAINVYDNDNTIYPGKDPFPYIFFKEPTTFNEQNGYSIKAKLIYKPKNQVIAEDYATFDMKPEYKS